MSVIPITIFFSLLLAGGFAALFAREQRRRRFASAERDSLLPLADETPRLAAGSSAPAPQSPTPDAPDETHDHDHAEDEGPEHHHHAHGKGRCGCVDGTRPPCTGCLRRTTATSLPTSASLR